MTHNGERSFLGGVLLLTLSAASAKICGVLFKIPLYAVLSDDGMGYFSSAYVIYTFFYMFTTSGLPLGVSLLVSRSVTVREQRAWLFTSLRVFASAGGAVCALMMCFPSFLARLVGNPRADVCIFVLGPTLFFVCVGGALRGYFQGKKNMLPTAVSQVIEAVLKTGMGLWFAYLSVQRGDHPSVSAAWGLSGVAAGSFLSMLYLSVTLFFDVRKNSSEPSPARVRSSARAGKLLLVILPVSAAAIVSGVSSLADLGVVMRRLVHIGCSVEEANRIYGNYSGLALPLFNLPAMLISPVASALIPHLSNAFSKGEGKRAERLSEFSLRLGALISAPCFAGLFLMSLPVLQTLFDDAAAKNAAPLLTLLSFSVMPTALVTLTTAILHASGARFFPLVSAGVGAAVKILAGWILIGYIGVSGAPLGTLAGLLTSSVMNLAVLYRKKLLSVSLKKTLLLPLFCAALCGGCAKGCFALMRNAPQSLALALSVAAAGGAYLLSAVGTGCIEYSDIAGLPGASVLARFTPDRKKYKDDHTWTNVQKN